MSLLFSKVADLQPVTLLKLQSFRRLKLYKLSLIPVLNLRVSYFLRTTLSDGFENNLTDADNNLTIYE